jgi:hypothetical protein
LTLALLAGCRAPRTEPPSAAPADASSNLGPWEAIGHSVEGRPIRMRRVGTGPRRVLWIGGIHGNEREGSVSTEELPAAFLARPGLADQVTLTIVEDVNPDGSAANTRANRNGVDLNRNWPAANFAPLPQFGSRPLSQPESRALHRLLEAMRPDLVLVAHSSRGRSFINFDGPARGLAQRFSALTHYPILASEELHGTPGSLGSYLGRDRQVPILTIEHRNGDDPGRCWNLTREAVLSVIAGG